MPIEDEPARGNRIVAGSGHLLAVWATFPAARADDPAEPVHCGLRASRGHCRGRRCCPGVASNASNPEIASYIVLGAPLYPIAELTVFPHRRGLSAQSSFNGPWSSTSCPEPR